MNKRNIIISILKIILFIVIYDVFEILGAICLELIGGNSEVQSYLADSIACSLMLLFYGVIFFKFYILKEKQNKILETSAGVYFKSTVITLGMGGVSFYWLCFVEYALQNIGFIRQSTERFQEFGDSFGQEPYFVVFLSVVAIGPIVEELIFRGLVFGEAEKIKGGWFPIVVSAVLFGLFHMEFVQIVYTILMGLIFGLIYKLTKSLPLVCYLHILNNLISTPPPFWDSEAFSLILTGCQVMMILPSAYFIYRWLVVYRTEISNIKTSISTM